MKQTFGLIMAFLIMVLSVIITTHSTELAPKDWLAGATICVCLGYLVIYSGRNNESDSHW